MDTFYLFTDGSVNTTTKVGYGAYIVVSELSTSIEIAKSRIKLKRFEDTSSSKLELQTLLRALSNLSDSDNNITIFTDSQNIIGLQGRREKLEHNNYMTKAGKLLTNHDLYKSLFKLIDRYDCTLQKVKGHQKTANKSEIERLFTLVDRASRKALRDEFS